MYNTVFDACTTLYILTTLLAVPQYTCKGLELQKFQLSSCIFKPHTLTRIPLICIGSILRNQMHAGRPACTWFLKIDPVRIIGMCVCMCVCVSLPPRLLITSGVIWCDMDPIRLVKQVLQLLYGNCSCYCYWVQPWHQYPLWKLAH